MIFEYFLEDLIETIESNNQFIAKQMTQAELREFFFDNIDEYGDEFPMICYEHTDDAQEEVTPEESKFFNDKVHDGTWIVGEKYGEVVFLLCLKEDEDELEIDTFEVAASERGNKISTYVVGCIEDCAEKYYESAYISPFDTNAMNFWNHMGYKNDYAGYYTKIFDNDYE